MNWKQMVKATPIMRITPLVRTLMSYIPFVGAISHSRVVKTNSARYYYSVWMRHMIHAYKNGLYQRPEVVAELGPGYSLGVGISALLSGAEKYYALDVMEWASKDHNLRVFDELCMLFASRASIPTEEEFPGIKPQIDSYDFPWHILSDEFLTQCLDKQRINKIRECIEAGDFSENSPIRYFVPWNNNATIRHESVDMIISQAVLEHIDDLDQTYRAMNLWLKPTGFMSHDVDFRCHGFTYKWNGHWTCSKKYWRFLTGKLTFSINRRPHSDHIRLLKENHFDVVCDIKSQAESGIRQNQLVSEFMYITDDDLITQTAFIQARKFGNQA